jgi:hypothetical protein
MAGLLAVGIAILLAIVISVSYALVLRELRQINANLEQLIELMAGARRHDERLHHVILGGIHKMPTGANLVLRPFSSSASLAILMAMRRASACEQVSPP